MRDTAEYPNDWARLVGELTRRPGWTQKRLADEVGVNRNTVRRWMNGESVNISATSMRLLARATGIAHETAASAALGAQKRDHIKDDEALDMITADPEIDDEYRARLIRLVTERRKENEASLLREIELLLDSGGKRQAL